MCTEVINQKILNGLMTECTWNFFQQLYADYYNCIRFRSIGEENAYERQGNYLNRPTSDVLIFPTSVKNIRFYDKITEIFNMSEHEI